MFVSNAKLLHDKSNDLLLLGECLVDVLLDTNGTQHLLFGGSPANIAMNIQQLNVKPLICATLGRDAYGGYLMQRLRARDIDTSLIRRSNHKTSFVVMNQTTDSPEPTFYRGCDYEIYYHAKLHHALEDTKILHFSYWPLTKEPSKTTVLKAVQTAKSAGALIAFDPNIHEALKSSESIDKEDLLELMRSVDIIKPSYDDAKRLFGGNDSKEAYMDQFESLGINLIMMTLGKDGVLVSHQGKRTHFSTRAKTVIDSTGAGDAFWSGFYAGLLSECSFEDTIGVAQAASAYALKQIGAITDFPSFSDLTKHVDEEATE